MAAYREYLKENRTDRIPSLKDVYKDDFRIGLAVAPFWLCRPECDGAVRKHFNSLTAENNMKPEALLSREKTLLSGSAERAAYDFAPAAGLMEYAMANGLAVRFHTLVWHSQTPRWFFAENWSDDPEAPLCSRETMIKRLENGIRDEMEYVNSRWPGLVYCWDVVNEAIEPDHNAPNLFRTKSNWYKILGEDFVELAFACARKYAAEGQKLFYNDFNVAMPNKTQAVFNLVKRLKDKNLVDGMGFQTHISLEEPDFSDYEKAVRAFSQLGLTIQATEMDVRAGSGELSQMKQAVRYKNYFSMLKRLKSEGVNIESVTLWGLSDDASWLMGWNGPSCPLLFDGAMRPKPAFFGAILDEDIPDTIGNLALSDAVTPQKPYKRIGLHNPVMTHKFGADPWAMPCGERVYLYMTGDFYEYQNDGSVGANHYGSIDCLRVLSSADLVNWTDHGEIRAAGERGAAKWARNSWAPAAAHKTIAGKEKYFVYFADSGNGIGVLSSDSPTGPFIDPLGKALVNRETPECADVVWLFDPAVLVDDDGRAYLYFGGGLPEGNASAPGTARCVELGADMISLKGEVKRLNPPYLFEDSGIFKYGNRYIYSYCTNFNVPDDANLPFKNGEICTMTADSPLGPFTFGDRVLKNPGEYFGPGGNNHHCMFAFRGKNYIAYHTQTLENVIGLGSGYRCTFIDEMEVSEDGHIALVKGTHEGAKQAHPFNPYETVRGATCANLAGMTAVCVRGGETALYAQVSGGWAEIEGADFGDDGARGIEISYTAVCPLTLTIALDSLDGECRAELPLERTGRDGSVRTFTFAQAFNGERDVYFMFSAPAVRVHWYRFVR